MKAQVHKFEDWGFLLKPSFLPLPHHSYYIYINYKNVFTNPFIRLKRYFQDDQKNVQLRKKEDDCFYEVDVKFSLVDRVRSISNSIVRHFVCLQVPQLQPTRWSIIVGCWVARTFLLGKPNNTCVRFIFHLPFRFRHTWWDRSLKSRQGLISVVRANSPESDTLVLAL